MYKGSIIISIRVSMISCLFLFFLISCEKKVEEKIASSYDPELVPTMHTHNDTMYISDSGKIRFKVISETMLLFDRAKEPYTFFPNKAYMEEFDSLMNVKTILMADSVWNYSKKKLWKLRGNVSIVDVEGKSYQSDELFWDEQKQEIYSNTYVVIIEPNEATIRAYGFVSNQSMTEYTFKRATNVDLYIKEEVDPEDINTEESEVSSEITT